MKHLGLARTIVNRFLDRGLDSEELMQEAFEAIVKAAHGYKPEMKFKFSTYASKCILNQLINKTRKSGDWMMQRRELPNDSLLAKTGEVNARPNVSVFLDCLPEREAMVLRLRFGLDREPLTLQEIGDDIGITKQRVRQIETRAIDRIRKSHGIEARRAS